MANFSSHQKHDSKEKNKKSRKRSYPKQVYVVSNTEDTNVKPNPINLTSQTAPSQSPHSSYNWSKESTSCSLEPSCPRHIRSAQSQRSSSDLTQDSRLAQQILATLSERNNSVVLVPFTRPSSPHDSPILTSIELSDKDSVTHEGNTLPSPKGTGPEPFTVPEDHISEFVNENFSKSPYKARNDDYIYEEFDEEVLDIAAEYYFARYGLEGLGKLYKEVNMRVYVSLGFFIIFIIYIILTSVFL
jgi:hypothetical protein